MFLPEIFGQLIHRMCKLYHATFEYNIGTTQIKYTIFCRSTHFMALMHTCAQKFKRTHVSCSRQYCWYTLPSPGMIIYQDHSGGRRTTSVNRTPGGFMITITLNNSWQRLIAWSRRDARPMRRFGKIARP